MKKQLMDEILQLNLWLKYPEYPVFSEKKYTQRYSSEILLSSEWDEYCLTLIGPRRAGKTTLGFYLANEWLKKEHFSELIYLSLDYKNIRQFLISPLFVYELIEQFHLKKPIIFLDEIQRIENPGLLLKAVVDLKLPIKIIATGSSQLEIKSQVQEHLTGRQLSYTVLPLSIAELNYDINYEDHLLYGFFPQVVSAMSKDILLGELYRDYVQKDLVEILQMDRPDVIEKLIILLAHQIGQLVNYQQLATDCGISVYYVKNYLAILEETYVIVPVRPFVGNKRTEVTSNVIYYFVDNGIRNYALGNFISIGSRTDMGFLVESFVFQEFYKLRAQNFLRFSIYYWRTKSGAEVDFILYKNPDVFLPVEVKFRKTSANKITRSLHSFIDAYSPKKILIVSQEDYETIILNDCTIHIIPLFDMKKIIDLVYLVMEFR